MRTLVINTKNWCRGDYKTEHGKMCALGFVEDQFGVDVRNQVEKNPLHGQIIDCNDREKGQVRRENLKKLFKQVGFTVKFKN